MKKITQFKWFIFVIVVSIITIATDSNRLLKISQSMENFADVYRIINDQYVDETDPNQLMRVALDSMLSHLDPYTNYFSESQMVKARMGAIGGWDGIGVELMKYGKKVVLKSIIEDSPAHKNKLRVGDVLQKIDETVIDDWTIEDISNSLQGKAGTKVTIEVLRPSTDTITILTLERTKVTKKNVPYYGMLNDETGYIVLTTFSQQAGANVKDAFLELQENHNPKQIILDLRNNGGGFLIEAVRICNIFLKKGLEIVYTRNKIPEWDRSFKTINESVDTKIPLIILINDRSASASEIVAGALQDFDRAILLGVNSFGKGLVQNTKKIGYSSKVKLTTAKYYIPSGRCVQALNYKNGVPICVPDSLRKEFKTNIGRIVYDGKGVEPDVLLKGKENSALLTALLEKHLIFDFANLYRENHDSIVIAKDFQLSDEEFNQFIAFVGDEWENYKTKSEVALEKVQNQARKEGIDDELSSVFNQSLKNIKVIKKNGFNKNKNEIKQRLQQEIVSRYYFMTGQVENRLAGDDYVNEAINLFSDMDKFEELLKPEKSNNN
ncbi:MAG: S41 family peptidase [Saprospiraceae bacterium]|nr:S41 family peptidase [Saprospiraceae bacterium]